MARTRSVGDLQKLETDRLAAEYGTNGADRDPFAQAAVDTLAESMVSDSGVDPDDARVAAEGVVDTIQEAQAERLQANLDRLDEIIGRTEPNDDDAPDVIVASASDVVSGFHYGGGAASVELPGMPPRQDDDPAPRPRDTPGSWGEPRNAEYKARTQWPVPQDSAFGGKKNIRAVDIVDMVDELIRTVPYLREVASVVVGLYWQRKGGSAHGKKVLSRVKKADGIVERESGAEILVILSADHLSKMRASELFVEKLVFGCLARIDVAGPSVLPVDFEANFAALDRYGYLGPDERVAGRFLARVRQGEMNDMTVEISGDDDSPIGDDDDDDSTIEDDGSIAEGGPVTTSYADSAGTLIHDDGTPLSADEIAEFEADEAGDA